MHVIAESLHPNPPPPSSASMALPQHIIFQGFPGHRMYPGPSQDVYAFAVVLLELCTQTAASDAPDAELQAVQDPVLRSVVTRGLCRSPEERATMESLWEELRGCQSV